MRNTLILIGIVLVIFPLTSLAAGASKVTFAQNDTCSGPGLQRLFESGSFCVKANRCEERMKNDYYRSVYLPPRTRVEIWEHAHYRGSCKVITNSSYCNTFRYSLGSLAGKGSSWRITRI